MAGPQSVGPVVACSERWEFGESFHASLCVSGLIMLSISTATPGFAAAFNALLAQTRDTVEQVDRPVAAIIAEVRARGDAALIGYTTQFDRLALTPATLRITTAEIDAATAAVPPDQTAALDLAATRIETFHRAQLPADLRLTDADGL